MSFSSVRVAALAFALSSWVEGLTHLRTVLLIPSLPGHDEEGAYVHGPPALPAHATWKDRIVAWIKRSGRRDVQMDDTERASMGAVDIAVSPSFTFDSRPYDFCRRSIYRQLSSYFRCSNSHYSPFFSPPFWRRYRSPAQHPASSISNGHKLLSPLFYFPYCMKQSVSLFSLPLTQ